jgi:hypothetical protein
MKSFSMRSSVERFLRYLKERETMLHNKMSAENYM